MVVLAIMGGLVALVAPYMTNRNSKTKSFLRHLVVMSRDLHVRAKMQGAVYRLVIDLKNAESRQANTKRPQQWWVERSNGKAVLKADEEAFARKPPEIGEKKEDPRGFAIDPTFSKGPQELPAGLNFDLVELTRSKNPITEGKAFINYLPEGLVDEAAIVIKGDRGQVWTLTIHPLTGKGELIPKAITLREIRGQ